MSTRTTTCFLVLVATACTSTEPSQPKSSSPPPGVLPAAESPPSLAPVSPHPKFPSGGWVRVIEPLEAQVGPGCFLCAPASQVMNTGDLVSQWPIYGAIVTQH
jgi:hypothetical protein